LDSGKKIVTDGALLEVREKISPALDSLKTKVKRSRQISQERAMESLPRPSEYRRSERIVTRVAVDEADSNLRRITSRDGHACLISADYLEYITTKYPQALMYVSGPDVAVIVEDSGELVAAVMPVKKGE
jgi:hypothetical protein